MVSRHPCDLSCVYPVYYSLRPRFLKKAVLTSEINCSKPWVTILLLITNSIGRDSLKKFVQNSWEQKFKSPSKNISRNKYSDSYSITLGRWSESYSYETNFGITYTTKTIYDIVLASNNIVSTPKPTSSNKLYLLRESIILSSILQLYFVVMAKWCARNLPKSYPSFPSMC